MLHVLKFMAVMLGVVATLTLSENLSAWRADDNATAELKNGSGQTIGRAQLVSSPHGVHLTVTLDKASSGNHAFHIHSVGRCEPPSFESAGDHFNPTGAQHGFLNVKGTHAGDLPNVHVPQTGKHAFELFVKGLTLQGADNSVLDADAAALVMHEATDDYKSAPAGNAGDRVACGVIVP
jgi:superoxide dismutase, Cu-Zn family